MTQHFCKKTSFPKSMLPYTQFVTSIHFIPFKPYSLETPLSHVIIQLLNQYIGINILIAETLLIYIHLHEEDNKMKLRVKL